MDAGPGYVFLFALNIKIFLVMGGGHGSIRLVHYSNPTNAIASGQCCDSKRISNCPPDTCDPYFYVCIDLKPQDLLHICQFGRNTTKAYQNKTNITFTGTSFDFKFAVWKPSTALSLTIRVQDYNSNGGGYLMNVFTFSFTPSIGVNGNLFMSKTKLTVAQASLTVEHGLACDAGYYNNCDVFRAQPTTTTTSTTTAPSITTTKTTTAPPTSTTKPTTASPTTTTKPTTAPPTTTTKTTTVAPMTSQTQSTTAVVMSTTKTTTEPRVTSSPTTKQTAMSSKSSSSSTTAVNTTPKPGLSSPTTKKYGFSSAKKSDASTFSHGGNTGGIIGGVIGGVTAVGGGLGLVALIVRKLKQTRLRNKIKGDKRPDSVAEADTPQNTDAEVPDTPQNTDADVTV